MSLSATAFQRARRPEHKQQRRAAILAAARALAAERGLQYVSLGDIATAAGMAKSNVLRYFETREEVYLQLTLEAYAEWVAAVVDRLDRRAASPAEVANVLADTLGDRPLVCDLFAHVSATLEHNVSAPLGRDFKVRMVDVTRQLAIAIAAGLPDTSEEQAIEMVAGTYALVAGLWPMCNPPADLAALLDGPAFRHTRVAFKDSVRRMLRALFVGLTRPDSTIG